MIVHGDMVGYDEVDGFIFGDWLGLVTFRLMGDDLEITSLNSLQEGRGIGTALVQATLEEAKNRKCAGVWLTTTNDNLHALGFYQKRGFKLIALYPDALDESRKLKPGIPLIGMNNIPLRDEIVLQILI
jgi:ribosomal protein S18 acetylase RimI-like enzyme